MLKAFVTKTLKKHALLLWLAVGLIGIIIGTLIGAQLSSGHSTASTMEGLLWESWFVLNSFLVSWTTLHKRQGMMGMSQKFVHIGLMSMYSIVFFSSVFLAQMRLNICPKLFERVVNEDLFKRRPPDKETKWEMKKKSKHRLCKLYQAINLISCLPVLIPHGRCTLAEELRGFVSTEGFNGSKLSVGLRSVLRADLAHNPRELEGIPGLKTAVADTGASSICRIKKEDFVPGSYAVLVKPIEMGGIAGGLKVVGKGKTQFEFVTAKGKIIRIARDAYHVPDLPVDLVPPQKIMRTAKDGWFKINGDAARLEFRNGNVISAPFDPVTRLPMFHTFVDASKAALELETSLYSCVTEESNQNLTRAKKEMLRWHWRLGHPGMALVKWLARRGLLGTASQRIKEVKDDEHPLCASCRYGKQGRKPTGATRTIARSDKLGKLKQEKLEPGDCVAVDQFVVKQGGRLFTTSGHEKEEDRFKGGTIFVDMATGKMYIRPQVSLGTEETLVAKACFEREAALNGVKIKHYHTDNGVFTSQDFVAEVHQSDQRLTYSGVGAHHQNGVAERAIGTVIRRARTQLLHAQLRWHEQTPTSLWPMSLMHAVWLENTIPSIDFGMSPDELFSRTTSNHSNLLNLHPWGCPTYVLMPTLQDGMKLPKWKPRARRGQFMGWSPLHSSSVGLIRNLTTGRLSPQFHVVFDPWFETVYENGDKAPAAWDILLTHHHYEVALDDTDTSELHDDWLTKEELAAKQARACRDTALSQPMSKQEGEGELKLRAGDTSRIPEEEPVEVNKEEKEEMEVEENTMEVVPEAEPLHGPLNPDLSLDGPAASLRLNPRNRRQNIPMNIGSTGMKSYFAALDRAQELKRANKWTQRQALVSWLVESMDPEEGYLDTSVPDLSLRAFKASKKGNNPDLPNYREAMTGPHRKDFEKAMQREIEALESHGTWRGVLRSSIPSDAEVVPLTWAFRIKRKPNGDFDKFKARLVVRGDLQRDERETYAPVVKWSTIRTVLAFALKNKLKTRQVDFDNAFVQAELNENESIFCTLPVGAEHPTHLNKEVVLQLQKSLYGMRDAPKFWFRKVKQGLESLGFVASEHDQCLFMHKEKKILLLLYVDDCLLFCEDDNVLQQCINDMQNQFQLTEQDVGGDVFNYLGIELTIEGTKVTMRQDGLMKKIFEKTGWQGLNGDKTPARHKPLGADLNGEEFDFNWEYSSVVGMLMFLVNTRPDIQFAVHQCARFTHNPKRSHGNAVKRIIRYLLDTRLDGKDRGLTFDVGDPKEVPKVECFVDADFAGLWNVEHNEDPVSSKSRTGFVVFVGNCPVIWQSKLQVETALSTTEAEVVALSQSMRELLWLRRLIVDIASTLGTTVQKDIEIKSKVFEDNNGAIALAHKSGGSSRTKHIHTKYWFFKENIGAEKGIVLVKIGTQDQLGDIFTKGVEEHLFVPLRDRLMGWNSQC